jgi:ubiquinone/menaquinone biosynthesis C-methylase UbiE
MKKPNENLPQSWDPIWEEVFLNQEWGKYPSENLIQFVARNFYKFKRDNIRILEVGCGTGANIWYIAREGFLAYGIDGSKSGIDQAKKRIKDEGLTANLVVGDVIELPYQDNFFDAVIDVECLVANNHDNTKLILKEINRILKKDGLFYSRTLSEKTHVGTEFTQYNKYEFNDVNSGPAKGKGFFRLIDEDEILNLYSKNFKIISVDLLEYTQNNKKEFISEYIIVTKK